MYMWMQSKNLLFIAFAVVIVSGNLASAGEQKDNNRSHEIKYELGLRKTRLTVGEKLNYNVTVTNNTTKSLWIEKGMIPKWNVFIALYDKGGKKVKFPDSSMCAFYPSSTSREDYVNLGPGFYYGKDMSKEYPFLLTKSGEYYVQAELLIQKPDFKTNFNAWYGLAVSPKVRIVVSDRKAAP